MTEDTIELRRIDWCATFPFVRLFRSARRAIAFWPMVLALAAVVLGYLTGRIFDGVWVATGNGIARVETISSAAPPATELTAYLAGGDVLRRYTEGLDDLPAETSRQGPYITLVEHLERCFAMALHGLVRGQWSLGDGGPSLLGGVLSAAGGLLWLVHMHPWYALIVGALHLLIFAFFGGAICRAAAILITRRHTPDGAELFSFAREKWIDLMAAPLFLIGLFAVVSVLLLLGGLVGAIPWVGEILVALAYGLALLGGVALVFAAVALVFGFHLMWPTIAVEGSDLFDAVQRSAGYVFQRAWSFGFYCLALLAYGGVSLIAVRGLALLLLKFTHTATGLGINFFGALRSSGDEAVRKLDGMWSMPAWADMSLLPSLTPGHAFWGSFDRVAELSGSEQFAQWLLMCWVFLVVGFVAAFVVSFYFCGCTEMYLVLRKETDGVDYDEMFYEEYDEDEFDDPTDDQSSEPTGGAKLPVVGDGADRGDSSS
ncbi:MAG: hypothetical protein D6744_01875 [Planctomycetota bacterium]|nr:MAG: hypothetical protein D6744_01875 [Planctomycetota bacterium]